MFSALSALGFRLRVGALEVHAALSLRTATLRFQEACGLRPTGQLDPHTRHEAEEQAREDQRPPAEGHVVRGYVRANDARSLDGVKVVAVDKDLRHEQALGEGRLDRLGRYEIGYLADRFRRAEKTSADVVVRAFDGDRLLAESEIFFNAPEVLIVNLTVGELAVLSEWEIVTRAIAPVLDGAEPWSLEDRDTAFLQRELELPAAEIDAFAAAHRVGHELELPPVVLYGLFRNGAPSGQAALLRQPRGLLAAAAQAALERRTIPPGAGREVPEALDRLERLALERSLDPNAGPDGPQLGRLLQGVLTTPASREAFGRLLASTATASQLWAEVERNPALRDQAPRLQYVSQLIALTGAHAPMVSALTERSSSLAELARWPKQRLRELVESVGAPASLPEQSAAGRTEAYVQVIDRMLEDAAPTARVSARLGESASNIDRELGSFLDANASFDLRGPSLARYFEAHPSASLGAAERLQLSTVQRLFKVTPRFDEVQVLRSNQLGSARQIAALPPVQLAFMMSGTADTARSSAIHESASRIAALTFVLESGLDPAINDTGTKVIQAPPAPTGAPVVRDLFGSPDYCECEECRSVAGPAAYLVDLLALLKYQKAEDGQTAYEKLAARRPDLEKIPLTCDNTNTALPYVDVVNELLEQAAATQLGIAFTAFTPTTTKTVAELRLAPEHLVREVYEKPKGLHEQKFPFVLPFALGEETARKCLAALGLPRSRLLELFRPLNASGAPAAADVRAAREAFGMPKVEWEIVCGRGGTAAELWGNPTDLGHVPELLSRSGLTIAELYALLDTQYLAQWGSPQITPADSCDTDDMKIAWPQGAVEGVARFLRLRRRLSVTVPQLDSLLSGLKVTDIKDAALVDLWRLSSWRAAYRLGWDDVLAWVADVSPALYDRLFNPPAPGNPSRVTALEVAQKATGEHAARLLAALQTSAEELGPLLDVVSLSAANTEAKAVTALSRVLRACSLARALRLRVPALLNLDALVGGTLAWSTAQLGTLIAAAARLSASGLDVREAWWLLRHEDDVAVPVGFSDSDVGTLVQELCVALVQVRVRTAVDAGLSTDETARSLLSLLLGPDDAGRALSLLSSDTAPAGADATFITNALAGVFPNAATALWDAVLYPGSPQRLGALVPKVRDSLSRSLTEDALVQVLSRAAKLDRALARLLLGVGTLRSDLEAVGALDPSAPIVAPAAYTAFRLVERIGLLTRKLALSDAELRLVIAPVPNVAWTTVQDLATPGNAGSFGRLLTLAAVATMRRRLLGRNGALADVLVVSATDVASAVKLLASRAGWDEGEALAAQLVLGAGQPADWPSGEGFLRLRDAMNGLLKLGAPMATVAGWLGDTIDLDQGEAARAQVRARIDAETWVETGQQVQDALREARRDALVGYLSSFPARITPEALFERYLLDVEMSACQLTSRIKAAIGSVQLFIQRCLMNLEDGLQLGEQVGVWWRWMQNFRVWQANRRVFLYPENWIEPELRDDKTPEFEKLEAALSQQDVSEDAVNDAFRAYLEAVHKIARLEVVGVFHDTGDERGGDFGVLHLLARSWAAPRSWYYRERVGRTRWMPWEKLDADIEGEHVMLTVHDGHAVVVWPAMKDQNDPDHPANAGQPPNKRWEIRFYWVERRHGRWSSKRSMDPQQVAHASYDATGRDAFVFRAIVRDGRLFVQMCHQIWTSDVSTDIEEGKLELTPCGGRLFPLELTRHYGEQNPWVARPSLNNQVGGSLLYGSSASVSQPLAVFDEEVDDSTRLEDIFTDGGTLPLFDSVPSSYWVAWDKQTLQVTAQHPFVFQDQGRTTYLFEPFLVHNTTWWNPIAVDPRRVGRLAPEYYEILRTNGVVDPVGPVMRAIQPTRVKKTVIKAAVQPENENNPPVMMMMMNSSASGAATEAMEWKKPILRFGDPDVSHFLCSPLYHPRTCDLMRVAERDALDELLSLDAQQQGETTPDWFDAFQPHKDRIDPPYPLENVEFESRGAYAIYNWELFFHAPFLLAVRLMQNNQWEAALKKLQLIFDPTSGAKTGGVERFWKFKPFFDAAQQPDQLARPIADLLALLGDTDPAKYLTQQELEEEIDAWRDEPFNPYLLARLRPVAFQKTVVMRYLDCLLGWGDLLFKRNTIETINQATLLYVLASNMLGAKPQRVPLRSAPSQQTFADLKGSLDTLAHALEDELPQGSATPGKARAPLPIFDTAHFCVPPNEKLLGYWDTVADRLFKIRHCQNIEGQVQQLPLFEPPIDPGLLVRAAAAGVDVGSVLNDLATPLPAYRFNVIAQKAEELCSDVRALGAELQSILEKRDAEALAQLRSNHEVALLAAVREVRKGQADEARHALRGLQQQRETVDFRRRHYLEGVQYMIPREQQHVGDMKTAASLQLVQGELEFLAGVLHAVPNFNIGASGIASPVATTVWGGNNLGSVLEAVAKGIGIGTNVLTFNSQLAKTMGEYDRRQEEWTFQGQSLDHELKQLDEQLLAAEIRVELTERELENHDLQREQARVVNELMRSKFTNTELFEWMVRQASAAYQGAYQLAYEMARRAERCYQFERAAFDRRFLSPVYWDNLRQGLLAADRLHHDLRRMEVAYLDDNRRELEITRHVSLALVDARQIVALREKGECEIRLDEAFFDRDFPGHYLRRLKAVAVTIPAVVGPHTSVNATLTLLDSAIRVKNDAAGYSRDTSTSVFRRLPGGLESIVTSSGQNDSGMFDPNLRDERYLPFEGAGAISRWRLKLNPSDNVFDLESVTDVVLHVRYTARDGGPDLAREARASLPAYGGARLHSARHDFGTGWAAFMRPPAQQAGQTLELDLSQRLPFVQPGGTVQLVSANVFFKLSPDVTYAPGSLKLRAAPSGPKPGGAAKPVSEVVSGLPAIALDLGSSAPAKWTLWFDEADLPGALLGDPVTDANGVVHKRLSDVLIEDVGVVVTFLVA